VTPYSVHNCPESVYNSDAIAQPAQQLQGAMLAMPNGFENPLLSNGNFAPSLQTRFVQPNRIISVGDAAIELRKDTYGEELMPTYFKKMALFNLAAYIRDSYEKLSEVDVSVPKETFLIYGVEGYLTQKYKHMLFTEDELPSHQEFLGPNHTNGKERWCANNLGAYYAWNCATLEEFIAIQNQIVNEINITSITGCGDLVSEKYVSMINRGKELIEDNTVGTRCTNCSDRKDAWKIGRKKTLPWCKWANKKQGTEISERCAAKDLNDECPETCHGCTIPPLTCSDRTDAWTIGRKTLPWCRWANKNKGTEISERCAKKDLYDECPRTCLNCAYD
jgi:hypothetical protein